MAYGAGVLLISAAVGYFVLERAAKHKGALQRVGQALGWLIILISLGGVACRLWYVSTGSPGMGFTGRCCQLIPKTAPMSPLPDGAADRPAP